jgi:FixJ family two-component response regulator
MPPQPSVFVIDSDAEHRRSLVETLRGIGFDAVPYDNEVEYLATFESTQAGVLLVVARKADDGLRLQEALAQQPLAPPLIFVASHNELPAIVRAVRQGALEYFQQQNYSETELWEAIQRGFVEDAARRERYAEVRVVQERLANLTDSEQRVLRLLIQGRNNHQIAKACDVSRAAVEGRRARLMRKLGVTSLARLVRLAIQANFPFDGERDGHGHLHDGATHDGADVDGTADHDGFADLAEGEDA